MSRLVVVTGAASGIGKAVTELLRSQGDTVIGVDLRDVEVQADLSKPEGRQAAVAEVQKLAGDKIDAAILCAGISRPEAITLAVNYFGVVEFIEPLRPLLAAADAPRVVVLASAVAGTQQADPAAVEAMLAGDEQAALAAGQALVDNNAGQQNYNSSKNAVAQWVRRSAVDWAGDGIALNAVAPGVVLTPMGRAVTDNPMYEEALKKSMPSPLGGFFEAEKIAPVIAFLASVENHVVTGQIIYADAGVEVTLRPQDRV